MKRLSFALLTGNKRACIQLVAIGFLTLFGATTNAQTWSGVGGNDLWSNDANWIGGVAPSLSGADVVIGGPSPTDVNINVNLDTLSVLADGIVDLDVLNIGFDLGDADDTLNNAGVINVGFASDFGLHNDVFNSGNINVGPNGDLVVTSDLVNLRGLGTITLSGGSIESAVFGDTLRNGNHTIQGEGQIGQGGLQIINTSDGLIEANVDGRFLTVVAGNSIDGFDNMGTVQASNGGQLIASGNIDNSGTFRALDGSVLTLNGRVSNSDVAGLGVIEAAGVGSRVRLDGASIDGGQVTALQGGEIRVTGNGIGPTFQNTTLSGNLVAESGAAVDFSGTINNSGTFALDFGSTLTGSSPTGSPTATVTGGGTLQLNGGTLGSNSSNSIFDLIIGDQTVQGSGVINNGVTVSAAGLVDANESGTSSLRIDGSLTNQGVLRASNGGTLVVDDDSFVTNDGGTIEALNNSTVFFGGSDSQPVTIRGGSLSTSGSGVLRFGEQPFNSVVVLDGVSNSGNLFVSAGSRIEIDSIFNNSGSITLESDGFDGAVLVSNSSFSLGSTDGVTLTGGGTITLSGVASILGNSNNSFVTEDLTVEDQTIEGAGSVSVLAVGENGVIDANSTGNFLSFGAQQNAGVLRASNGGTLGVSLADSTGGTIEALAGSEVVLLSFGERTIREATFQTEGDGVVSIVSNNLQSLNLIDITNTGNLTVESAAPTISGTIENSGSISIAGDAFDVGILSVNGSATLTGGGTVTLEGGSINIGVGMFGQPIDGTLTLGDQTLQGTGDVSLTAIVNSAAGIIDANDGELSVSVLDVANEGVIRASNGGSLSVTTLVDPSTGQTQFTELNNTGGRIEALADSAIDFSNTLISGGTLSNVGGEIRTTGLFGLDDVTVQGDILLEPFDPFFPETATALALSNAVSSTGTIQSNGVVLDGDATLTGGGTISLSGSTSLTQNQQDLSSTLTIDDHTIEGSGELGLNSFAIVNSSGNTILGNDQDSSLTIDTGAGGLTNQGTIAATDGGRVVLSDSVVENSTGVIQALAGSEIRFGEDVVVRGGSVSAAGDGQLVVGFERLSFGFPFPQPANTLFDAVALSGDLSVEDQSTLQIANTINNSATITIEQGSGFSGIGSSLAVAANATLTGGGTVMLDGDGAVIEILAGNTLTIDDQIISGTGQIIGLPDSSGATATLLNSGLIDASFTGGPVFAPPGIGISGVDINNNGGILRAFNGVLTLSNAFGDNNTINNAGGSIEALQDSTVELANGITIVGGELSTVGNGLIAGASSLGGNGNVPDAFLDGVTNSGTIGSTQFSFIAPTFGISNEIVNTGSITANLEVQADGATLSGGGTVNLEFSDISGAELTVADQVIQGGGSINVGTLTVEQEGVIIANGLLTIDSTDGFFNNGTLIATENGDLGVFDDFTNSGTIDLQGGELFANSLLTETGSFLLGNGSVNVSSDGSFLNAGTIAPGDLGVVGMLAFLDDTEFADTSFLDFDLESASSFDVLNIDGEVTLDGVLGISLASDFTAQSTDVFDVLTGTSFVGGFSNVNDGRIFLEDGSSFAVLLTDDSVQLTGFQLSSVPEPGTVTLLVGMAAGLMLRRRRQAV